MISLLPGTIVPFSIGIAFLTIFYIIPLSQKTDITPTQTSTTVTTPVSEAPPTTMPSKAEQKQVTLRSKLKEGLTEDAVQSMLQLYNFYCGKYDWSKEYCNPTGTGIQNNFEKQSKNGGAVVIDHASGLMWQQSGSKEYMNYKEAKEYIQKINTEKFAGYDDWRLPTLEEAVSLMEPKKMNGDLYIDPKFDIKQRWIWTSDTYSASSAWVVNFGNGNATATSSTVCVPFAEDNHRLFNSLF